MTTSTSANTAMRRMGASGSGATRAMSAPKIRPETKPPMRRIAVLALVLVVIGGGTAWWLHSRDYIRHMQRGVGFLREGKTDQAVNEFQTVIGQRSDYAAAHFALARSYAIKGDLAHAETA